jgi:hypothetical protein
MVGPDGLSIFRGISNTQPKLRAGSASVRGCWRFQIMPSKKRAFQRFLNSFWISLGIMAQKFSISLILKTSIVNLARTDASRIPIIRPAPIANMGDTFDRSALGATRSRNFDCDPLRSPCVLPQVPLWVPKMPSKSFRLEFHKIDEFNFDSAFVNSDTSASRSLGQTNLRKIRPSFP